MEFIYYIIIIFAIILLYFLVTFIINKLKENLAYDEIEEFCENKGYSFQKVKDNRYDAIINGDDFKMYVILCRVPEASSVTINSRNTWCLRFGGKRKGKGYSQKRYLNEISPFLNFNEEKNLIGKTIYKVVIFYPNCEAILKYMNESEIMEIKPNNISFGYKAITYKDFFSKFDDLLVLDQKELSNPRNK
ncbi:MAG: hypothetical protein J5666_01750 [Bacilli bacterium]|nr:hypothetical protein [Bacilli bacterium]